MNQTFTTQLQTQSLDDNGKFSGYGSVFNVRDGRADIIQQGAFTKSLASWKEKNALPSLLWQHNHDEPIGRYTRMEQDEKGLYVEGELLIQDDPLAKRAYAHLKAGSVSGLSIGYEPVTKKYEEESDVFVMEEVYLWEVSLVTFPANDKARIRDVQRAFARGDMPTKVEVERSLREAGFSHRQAKAIISKGYNGLLPRDAGEAIEQSKVNSLIKALRGKNYA